MRGKQKHCAKLDDVFMKCRELAKDFVVAGTASESLYGACEAMYKPDLVSSFLRLLLLDFG